ncbi:hypothetical protein [Aquimarina sp. 2201CG5-10]|uniref:hypothetical protein n=1 Tax=Aquimarina callyspongiae TaxID=3098150 RepID=UPI002AB4A1A8|nr:hypothetical protein [Aquimarina sp. 2201CG5-10]MDY8136195.1 hypothetical protein [Aquimarina sp. 2201CG5-10]
MKTNAIKIVFIITLLIGAISCQKEDDVFIENESLIENENLELDSQKSANDVQVVCSIDGIPPGFKVEEYLTIPRCPNVNLFLGRYNAAIVSRDGTPKIFRAGAGCDDNYCIWIVGDNFESNAYVDIRTTTGSSIIGTYRGSNRQQYVNAQGQDVITLRLGSAFERTEFASRGLRIWVVNPEARKWADGRTVRRPNDHIDPPCDPICP